jgi:lipid-binding SYLF domain-containing protein
MKRNKFFEFVLVLLLSVVFTGGKPLLAGKAADEVERAQKSADVLAEIMSIPEGSIPDDLMERARGIAVIPHVVKGAFGIGGSYGKGLISQRQSNGRWSTPAFIDMGGGSLGFQIGVQATDVILVFTNEEGIKSLLSGKVTLGGNASVAAGPVGRQAKADTDIKLNSAIYSYSRSKGLFAGVSLEGAVITIDNDENRRVYGKNVTGEEILLESKVRSNPTVAPFMIALEKYSPSRRMTH